MEIQVILLKWNPGRCFYKGTRHDLALSHRVPWSRPCELPTEVPPGFRNHYSATPFVLTNLQAMCSAENSVYFGGNLGSRAKPENYSSTPHFTGNARTTRNPMALLRSPGRKPLRDADLHRTAG